MTEEPENMEIQDQTQIIDVEDDEIDAALPQELAILPLRGVVVYPLTFQALNVG